MIRFIFSSFIVWRLGLNLFAYIALQTIYLKRDFVGSPLWANFDGVHYLAIAEGGYHQYQHAFFPLFPLLIRALEPAIGANYSKSGLLIVHGAFILSIFLFWKLVTLDFSSSIGRWAVVFLLVFPTSFFFASIYTESLFFLFAVSSFFAARRKRWFWASVLGAFAAATKFVGLALLPALIWEWWEQNKLKMKKEKLKIGDFWWLFLIPLPLIGYMIYLYFSVGDPLAFIHAQPAFGANRSGGELIFLPQVLFRYLKIFATVSWVEYDMRIAFLEFFLFSFVLGLLVLSWKTMRKSYLIFSLLLILIPTLTGTLSSMPRYVLVIFPLYTILATLQNNFLKLSLCFSFLLLLAILTMLFIQGYFVA